MNWIAILFAILTVVNFTPSLVALAPSKIAKLHGVEIDDKTLIALLQHRAVLLGLVGAVLGAAIFMPALRWPALVLGAISMVSFIVICAQHKQLRGPLWRIAFIDALALPVAVVLAWLMINT